MACPSGSILPSAPIASAELKIDIQSNLIYKLVASVLLRFLRTTVYISVQTLIIIGSNMTAAISTPVKLAIVGTGLIGPRHAEAIVRDANAELVCIVDPNPAAKAIAEKIGCAYHESIQRMLDSSRPDGALVCTPNDTHVALSKQLLRGGLHVLCEKPISIDSQSGKELVWNLLFCRSLF